MARSTRGKDAVLPAQRGSRRQRAVFVFTEGKVTEPEYIESVKALVRVPANVRVANKRDRDSVRTPSDLVGRAIDLLAEKEREEKKAKDPKALRTQVWCLFDHGCRDHDELNRVLTLASKHRVGVAFSHPCFELWRLLHLKPASGTFGGVCGQAEKRLPADFHQVTGGSKYVVPGQIKGGYEAARERALKLNAQHSNHVPRPSRDPYTDVHDFVETGMGITAY